MGLAEAAAAAAGRIEADIAQPRPDYPEPDFSAAEMEKDPEKVDTITAWLRVMGDVTVIHKAQKFEGGKAGRFNFRGVDAVLNAFGPICRKHGIAVFPFKTVAEYRDIGTASGGKMRECTATVTYRIYGPTGDFIETQAMGEATDTGSRSTPKAQSVALRTLMLTGGMVPTEEQDPDADTTVRGEAGVRSPESYRDELLLPGTTLARTEQIGYEIGEAGLFQRLVLDRAGQPVTLLALGKTLLAERAPQPAAPSPDAASRAVAEKELRAAGAAAGMSDEALQQHCFGVTDGPIEKATEAQLRALTKELSAEFAAR
jgi:hypothetical protein